MKRAAVLVVAAVLASACGYALAGRSNNLPATIKTIGVPLFQNLTSTPELDHLFTEAVRIELAGRGRYTVVPDSAGVDALLTVSIKSLTPVVQGFTTGLLASKYDIFVVASATLKDLKDNKELYNNASVRVKDEFDVTGGAVAGDIPNLFSQNRDAQTRLAKQFAKDLVSAILSNF